LLETVEADVRKTALAAAALASQSTDRTQLQSIAVISFVLAVTFIAAFSAIGADLRGRTWSSSSVVVVFFPKLLVVAAVVVHVHARTHALSTEIYWQKVTKFRRITSYRATTLVN